MENFKHRLISSLGFSVNQLKIEAATTNRKLDDQDLVIATQSIDYSLINEKGLSALIKIACICIAVEHDVVTGVCPFNQCATINRYYS